MNLRDWKSHASCSTEKRKRVESPAKSNKQAALNDLELISELGLGEGEGEGEAGRGSERGGRATSTNARIDSECAHGWLFSSTLRTLQAYAVMVLIRNTSLSCFTSQKRLFGSIKHIASQTNIVRGTPQLSLATQPTPLLLPAVIT